ncbi:MAG TPA: ATP-binding cassette domain-containing protein [Galbitalea sp.]|nr:ATP-binding cassette domain-containing protein [Galbitalea sp.]
MLTYTNVSYRRGLSRRPIFDDFSFQFAAFPCALLGPNGAGKSTLLQLTATALRPSTGQIGLALGKQRSTASRSDLRRRIALVSQTPSGFRGLTVREAVAYAGWLKGLSRAEAWERSISTIDRMNLSALADVSSIRISGGELRRLAIAQALVINPEVLLLDEATTGLDPSERRNLLEIIADIADTVPTLAATHEVDDLQSVFAHVAVLLDGRILFDGPTGDFLGASDGNLSPRERAEHAYARALNSGAIA